MLLLYTSIESDDVRFSAVHSKILRKKTFVVLDLYNQAEVQSVFADGSLSLHTRSLKYGKVGINYWEFSIIMYLTHKNCTLRYSFSKVYIFLHIPVYVFTNFHSLDKGPWSRFLRLWLSEEKHISITCLVEPPLFWETMAMCGSVRPKQKRWTRQGVMSSIGR